MTKKLREYIKKTEALLLNAQKRVFTLIEDLYITYVGKKEEKKK